MATKQARISKQESEPEGKPTLKKLVKADVICEQLGISRAYLDILMRRDGLPCYHIGRALRFELDEVADWLQNRRNQSA